jgi:hypothetical protein
MPLQLQDESLSISVWCVHNQMLFHFKVRPSTVLDRVYHALLRELAQDVPCVVRDVSDMRLLLIGNILNQRKSIQANNILPGDQLEMFLSNWGLVQTTAALLLLCKHMLFCSGQRCHTVPMVIA